MEKVLLLRIVCLVELAVVYINVIPPVSTFSKILHVLITEPENGLEVTLNVT